MAILVRLSLWFLAWNNSCKQQRDVSDTEDFNATTVVNTIYQNNLCTNKHSTRLTLCCWLLLLLLLLQLLLLLLLGYSVNTVGNSNTGGEGGGGRGSGGGGEGGGGGGSGGSFYFSKSVRNHKKYHTLNKQQ